MGRDIKPKIFQFIADVLYRKIWLGASASAQGRSHIKVDVPCQDSTCTESYEGCTVVALSDGAGSKQYSYLGSRQLVKAICDLLTKDFDILFGQKVDEIKKKVYSHLMSAMTTEAQKNNISISELSSTLLAIAIKYDRILSFHIGDGCIGFLNASGSMELFSEPFNGEYPNSTIFFTSPNGLDQFRCYKGHVSGIEGFILMSDGSADSLYLKKDKSFANACSKMINMLTNTELDSKELLTSSLNLIRNRTFDDCSVALLKKAGQEKREFEQINKDLMETVSGTQNDLYWRKMISLWEQIEYHQTFSVKKLSLSLPYRRRQIKKILNMTRRYVKQNLPS